MEKNQTDTAQILTFNPLTPETWKDFELLFGPKGAYSGCWCMWWRLKRSEFEQGQGEKNRESMKSLVWSGIIPGIIAYDGKTPCGWCSVAPREQFGTLERSRILRRLDDKAVWSLVCFFIAREYRGQNLGEKLIYAAIDYVRENGGKIIEAYPTAPRKKNLPPVSSYMGIPKMFERCGFKEEQRASKAKIIMRYYINN